ncbi:hypothetical protein [Niallia sp. FSL W8-0635]|uniref:hypothetical protein n=1 Tax=Niallia sp. FSL W8-0635 TaxID=2975337 RepID=UPI0009CC7BFA|nr:Uncharacterised protein [Mycobacteroides abscessus subsp. abscessus]HEO8420159.1 hypothetical protein [Yersinia enterocolitica]
MVRVALNFAIMLEQVKSKGYQEEEIIQALEKKDLVFFQSCGNGLPNWETLFTYYEKNRAGVKDILADDYEITFLTKGTLKRLLSLKYQMVEGRGFEDRGEVLGTMTLSKESFQQFAKILAKNWTFVILEENTYNVIFDIKLSIIE